MQQFNNQVLPITVIEAPGQFTLTVGIDYTNPKQYAVVGTNQYGVPTVALCHYHNGHWLPFIALTKNGAHNHNIKVVYAPGAEQFLEHYTSGSAFDTINATLVNRGECYSLVSTLGGTPTVVTINSRQRDVLAYVEGRVITLVSNGAISQHVEMSSVELNMLLIMMSNHFGGVNQNYSQPNYGFGGFTSNPRPQGGQPYGGAVYGQPHYGQPHNYGQPAGPIGEGNYRSAGPNNNAYSNPETLIRSIDVVRLKSGEFAAPSQSDSDTINGLILEVHRTNNSNMHRITLPVGESQTIVGYISMRDGNVEGVMTTGNYSFTSELCKVVSEGQRFSVPTSLDYQQTSMGYDINVVDANGVVSVRVKQKAALTLVDALYAVICNWPNVSSGDKPLTEEQYAIVAPAIFSELSEQGCGNLVQMHTDTTTGIKFTVHMVDDVKQITAETTDLSFPKTDKFKAMVKLVCVDVEPTEYVDLKTVADLL